MSPIKPLKRVVKGVNHLLSPMQPKIPIRLEKGNYIVKTIDEPWEFQEVLKLRYAVFHKEYRKALLPFGWDLDDFDFICDHLIIIQKDAESPSKRGTIVGTYRLICSKFSDKYYSQTEFQLDRFMTLPGVKLELGRACIHPDFRKGSVMNLLWRGVSEYLRLSEAKYLFGCSSVKVMDTPEIEGVYRHLESKGYLSEEYGVTPLPKFEVPGLAERLAGPAGAITDEAAVKELMPPLLEMYLLAGAKVIGRPALDREFRCIDFLTILDTANLSQLFSRRYQSS